MKLKPEDRAELVSNLTTNCDCWKHEGSEEVLNALPDEQLIALNEQSATVQELVPVINQIAMDFKVCPKTQITDLPKVLVANAAAFDGSGGGGGGDTRANADEDDPEGNYLSEEGEAEGEEDSEGNYAGDDQKKGIESATTNKRRKPMNIQEYLKTVPPEFQVIVRNGLRKDAEEKVQLIEEIVANANNPYEVEQLESMTTEQLRPLAQLAKPVIRNRAPVANTNGHAPRSQVKNFYGKQGAVPTANRKASEDDEDEGGLLITPTINWAENLKELRGSKD